MILHYEAIVYALDTIIDQSKEAEAIGIWSKLLSPDNALFFLLLADILAHVNHFLKFLQKRNLMYNQVNNKLD